MRTGRDCKILESCPTNKGFKRLAFLTHRLTHFLFDSIYLNYGFINNCAINNKNKAAFLMNQGLALSCPDAVCGQKGLKNKIVSLTISSDSVYNNLPANTSINNYFQVNLSNKFRTLDAFVSIVNANGHQLQFEQFVITTKPSNNKGHVFKLEVQFDDGTVLTASTKRIFWQ